MTEAVTTSGDGGSDAAQAPDGHPDTPGPYSPPTPSAVGAERFDELVQVVRPWMKTALLISALTIAGALVWATLATITTSTKATAALLPSSGMIGVTTAEAGVLEAWSARVGQTVASGDVLGTMLDLDGRRSDVKAPVAGKVETILLEPGTAFERGKSLALMVPSASERLLVTFLPPSAAESVAPKQQSVVTLPGCPTYNGEVAAVLPLPLTAAQIDDATGLPGVVPLIAPAPTGTGVVIQPPDSWCPEADYGRTGSLVITTGSTHPIDYLLPGS